ncbi:MAG: zinc metallopeptidase [Candidatus Cryptobacteroides sp.]
MNIWLIMILVMVLSFIVQNTLQSRFSKYSRVRNSNGMTGAEIASMMLRQNGIYDVRVECIEGQLTDHYNPQTKTVNLSRSVYEGNSIAAAAVAAHECGHVLQHATGYAPLRFRTWLVPVVTLCNSTVQWVLLIGVILINITPFFFNLGIALFATTTLFSLVTLPVEINASYRAINWLTSNNIADSVTKPMAIDALKWAAYTYVIAAIGSLATLLYYIGLASRRD